MWLTQPMSLQYIPTPAMQNNELSLIELDCLLTGLNMVELASLTFLPSHPLVMITVKDRKSVSFLKLEPFLFTVAWLSLLYKFTRFFIYFLFLSDEGPMLETLDFTIRIGSTDQPFHISICSLNMVELASMNIVKLASLNMVQLASLNMVELASMNIVELAS